MPTRLGISDGFDLVLTFGWHNTELYCYLQIHRVNTGQFTKRRDCSATNELMRGTRQVKTSTVYQTEHQDHVTG